MNRTKVFPEEVVTAAMLLPGSYPDLLGMQDDDGHHHHHHCHHRRHHNHLDVEIVTGAMLLMIFIFIHCAAMSMSMGWKSKFDHHRNPSDTRWYF